MEEKHWKRCSTCKKPIAFGSRYYLCNVSTCNRKRTGLVFCSVECWDGHLPIVRHRESWSLEKKAPSEMEWQRELQQENEDRVPAEERAALSKESQMETTDTSKEILVVVSKLKGYIKTTAAMNTSADVMEVLSDRLRKLCDDAVQKARQEGRKTVMARDF